MDWRDFDALGTARSQEWDLGSVCEAVTAKKWWLLGPPLAALLLMAGLLFLQPPRYSAESQVLIGPRTAGLIGLRSSFVLYGGASGQSPAAEQAQLIASRDLARRAIKDLGIEDNPEFDSMAQSLGPLSRALIFLGFIRDPTRQSPEERVLEAYQNHLQIHAPGRGSLVSINFQSEDRALAAKAANRIAELYLEMRSGANVLPGDARIVSRAIVPARPVFPEKALLFLSGAAMFVMGFGAFVSIASAGRALPARPEAPVEQPRALEQVRVFARLKHAAQSNPMPGRGLPSHLGRTGIDEEGNGQAMAKIMARILSVPFDSPGVRGIRRGKRIVATSFGPAEAASGMMRDLARDLAREGRSIVIGLDESGVFDFGGLAAAAPHGEEVGEGAERGLCDLLNGTASFSEVIRRDPASRLHFLRAGSSDELNLHEFTHVLDALAETYDFLLIIATPLDQNSVAETLAAQADFAVLAMPAVPQGRSALDAEARLIGAGAREVLLIGLPAASPARLGADAA